MKYCIVILDGAAGWPIADHGGKTSLELARKPNLDALAREGYGGFVRNVPPGMEPGSAPACMSLLGYDPLVYYKGRSGIEAISMGTPIADDEVVFRCNLVAVRDGVMWSYSSGRIPTEESEALIAGLNEKMGSDTVTFYPGVSYRHICKIKGGQEALNAECTPPHDISEKPIAGYLPRGRGSELLNTLMERSVPILAAHPVNKQRIARGDIPATMIWLFWGSAQMSRVPSFKETYGVSAAMTSGVDLLRGLAKMFSMDVLSIKGVTDGPDNDYKAQTAGAIKALQTHDLVVIHIEAPDEAGHSGALDEKVEAIERIDREVISELRKLSYDIRIMALPDHPTPVKLMTHTDEPVPFIIWGPGMKPSGAASFSEPELKKTGIAIEQGYTLMKRFISGAV